MHRQRKTLNRSEPVSHSTENGLPFFVLEILDGKKGISQSFIEEKCGRYVSRIVAPRSLLLPDNGCIKRFTPGFSNGIFIFNTAVDAIKSAKLRPEEICITVVDRNSVMNGEIHRLLPFSSTVRAITARCEKYSAVCNEIYDEYGASVIVRPVYQPVRKKEIVICCDGATTDEMNKSAVFSHKRCSHGRLRFFSHGITLSDNHKKIISDNIESVDFAAAVTELCGSTEYRFSPFSATESNCSRCSNATVADCIECYAINA